MTTPFRPPDLSNRTLQLTVAREMKASPAALYKAWTTHFDSWFAAPSSALMQGEVNTVFFFEVEHDGNRHPHYGRFLTLEPDRLVELTWVTGGTKGAETVVRVELTPLGEGTLLTLTHAGFPDAESRDGHDTAWPHVLAQLDERMAK